MTGTRYRLAHNTRFEGARIMLVELGSLMLALLTVPWRLLLRRKP